MTALTLPELVIEASPTFVIASAIATRDFQDVHHDRDRAVQRGSKDIFVNILTTTGLVQRFVTDWAGPQAVVRKVAIRLGAPQSHKRMQCFCAYLVSAAKIGLWNRPVKLATLASALIRLL